MIHAWPVDYNAELSMRQAMMKADEHMEHTNGTMGVDVFMARVANVDMWVRIAQVHATNMLTEAVRNVGTAIRLPEAYK